MKIREMLDRLDEISRRDFLKGVGATAGLAATGSALGQNATPDELARLKAAAAAEKARADQLDRLKVAYGIDQIYKKVYPLIVFDVRTLPPQENPAVVVQINPGPYGVIEKVSVVKPSPYPDWDKAVVTAIQRAETLPPDTSGKFPDQPMNVMFKPKSSWSTPNEQGAIGYADRVRRKLKPLIRFDARNLDGNPAVVFLLDLAPDGTILKRTLVTPSSVPAWDQAVAQAIDQAESLPGDENGRIPMRQIRLTFKPKD
jgi:TonB family protein